MGTMNIASIGPNSATETTTGTFTDTVDLGDSGRVDVAVDTSGAATLTVEFSLTGDFSGEQFEVTTDYASATEIIEQFSPAHQYVRASVDANLNRLEVVSRGV